MQLGGLPIETDVSSAVWISSGRRRGTPGTVGALVPAVFEAYARVLHPAVRYAGDDDVEVPWAEVAAHNGTVVHPLVQWVPLTGSWEYRSSDSQPPVWDDAPSEGHLPVTVAARLAAVRPPPGQEHGMSLRALLADLDLVGVPADGAEARDVDTWADWRDLQS